MHQAPERKSATRSLTVLLKNLLVWASSIALIGDLKPQTCMCVSGRHRENCETPALSERRPHNRTGSLCDCESETETWVWWWCQSGCSRLRLQPLFPSKRLALLSSVAGPRHPLIKYTSAPLGEALLWDKQTDTVGSGPWAAGRGADRRTGREE